MYQFFLSKKSLLPNGKRSCENIEVTGNNDLCLLQAIEEREDDYPEQKRSYYSYYFLSYSFPLLQWRTELK